MCLVPILEPINYFIFMLVKVDPRTTTQRHVQLKYKTVPKCFSDCTIMCKANFRFWWFGEKKVEFWP